MNGIAEILKTVAPWLASAVTGPLGGMAVKFITDRIGLPDSSIDAVNNWVTGAKPEDLAKLKQIDNEFKIKMQELGFEHQSKLAALEVEDRKSARGMISEVKVIVVFLALSIVIGTYVSVAFVFNADFEHSSESKIMLIGTVTGYIFAALQQVLGYFFGSSQGSETKNEMMKAVVNLKGDKQ